ncbi:hypothetical protein JCM8097_004327 [Rhodosporidiobolus ruineniae]
MAVARLPRTRSLSQHHGQQHRHVHVDQLRLTEEFRRIVAGQEKWEEEAVELDDLDEDEDDEMSDVEMMRETQERAIAVARLEGTPPPSPLSRPYIRPMQSPTARLRTYYSESDVRRASLAQPPLPSSPTSPSPAESLAQRRGVRVVSIVKAEKRKLEFELGKPKLVSRSPLSPRTIDRNPYRSSAPVQTARKVRSSSRLAVMSSLGGEGVSAARRLSLAEAMAARVVKELDA